MAGKARARTEVKGWMQDLDDAMLQALADGNHGELRRIIDELEQMIAAARSNLEEIERGGEKGAIRRKPDDDEDEMTDDERARNHAANSAGDDEDEMTDDERARNHADNSAGGDVEVGSYERNGRTVRAYSRSRRGGKSYEEAARREGADEDGKSARAAKARPVSAHKLYA